MTLRLSRQRAASAPLAKARPWLTGRPMSEGEGPQGYTTIHNTARLEEAECMIHHWGNTIASNAKLFEPFYCAIIYMFCIFCNWTACSVCFGYLERSVSLAGGVAVKHL